MTAEAGRILVVDDNLVNRTTLQRALQVRGYSVTTAENGRAALELLRAEGPHAFDAVLLDILMPEMNGYEVLSEIKGDGPLGHIPVIMISALDEMDSVIRCIEMGATDYLPKPFNAALLQARLGASLAGKRLRDLELEYLEQVGRVTAAAGALETGSYESSALEPVAARQDALGQLARVFRRMADEVRAREERLKQELRELKIEIDQVRQAKKVAEITGSEYFQELRRQADNLRGIVKGQDGVSATEE